MLSGESTLGVESLRQDGTKREKGRLPFREDGPYTTGVSGVIS